jgi:hypothetical protein
VLNLQLHCPRQLCPVESPHLALPLSETKLTLEGVSPPLEAGAGGGGGGGSQEVKRGAATSAFVGSAGADGLDTPNPRAISTSMQQKDKTTHSSVAQQDKETTTSAPLHHHTNAPAPSPSPSLAPSSLAPLSSASPNSHPTAAVPSSHTRVPSSTTSHAPPTTTLDASTTSAPPPSAPKPTPSSSSSSTTTLKRTSSKPAPLPPPAGLPKEWSSVELLATKNGVLKRLKTVAVTGGLSESLGVQLGVNGEVEVYGVMEEVDAEQREGEEQDGKGEGVRRRGKE